MNRTPDLPVEHQLKVKRCSHFIKVINDQCCSFKCCLDGSCKDNKTMEMMLS